ncbi:DNA polymerase [Tuanshanicoccus lijuaniae]|uniref:DNA polymerase n=1 Tax=Aerococcaceae bacterium zg-1292 TaxID=2774330 RepID=UPI001935DED6|nr:DNA polymerase [Aerococcaceae bacterium zg-1292]QQA38036.1 DNA polymerase [Aerococcaceae bacterium zg-1292]
MRKLNIDIETFSSVSLSKSGVYKYAESEDFQVLLFSYAVDDGDVQVVDLAKGERLPSGILEDLQDDSVLKWAFNAQFERVCLSRYLGIHLNPLSWRCTMVWSAYMGLPLSLEGVGAVLGLEEQKLKTGKDLIRYFCVPCTPTKSNGQRTRNYFFHNEDKWRQFKAYNKRDVEVEMAIARKLDKFQVPNFIWDEYVLDQIINDRGIQIDSEFVQQAIQIDEQNRTLLLEEQQRLTQLDNPNSVVQLSEWLTKQGMEVTSLDKKSVNELLQIVEGKVAQVLYLRQQLAKSSVKKYQAMQLVACKDNRCRGMFQFFGANRTGRFSGRLVQLQNLPQNHMKDLKEARELVKQSDIEALSILYYDTSRVLSELIRTAFIPNGLFYVVDFSAIEARVIAWLAKETWRENLFKKGGDIYCMSASQMFGVPVEKHGVNGELRQKGKIAELACGYGGSVGALTAMGALEMGLKQEELQPLVNAWRGSNQKIVKLWWAVDKCVKATVKERKTTITHGITFTYQSGMLFITLPSGRRLTYIKPRIGENKFGGESVTYEGIGSTKKWERIESYGPKFVENIVQAIARDILMYAMINLKDYSIVAHVHDEVIIEAKDASLDEICRIMRQVPPWANGLILDADGYTCEFYKKD